VCVKKNKKEVVELENETKDILFYTKVLPTEKRKILISM
jgi:hypothetical protein